MTETPTSDRPPAHTGMLALTALGVVFGDIGTSPLYALRECFSGEYGISPTPDAVLGVLSLMFWSLVLVVSVKYLGFILRADNEGEGGVIALTALVRSSGAEGRQRRRVLLAVGLFAASLLYGDGMITPAISVLSAVEGLQLVLPSLETWVIPATVTILALLFLLQHRGTARVGALFGPVIGIWFVVIAALGLAGIAHEPGVLAALGPWHGLHFLTTHGSRGLLVMGAVFLVVTGAEALYADMGHFGRRPIRRVWFLFVGPALLLSYFGQGALLLADATSATHPFYALVPDWGRAPMVVLATLATIIASQAVITGAFSLTRQAIQLGYCPRLRVVQTSEKHIGQIYLPTINWMLMLCTIALVLGFRSSSRLAAAYGVAVTTTMLISTVLIYVTMRERWGWNRWAAGVPAALFLLLDLVFFGANVSKIAHGAWFPLAVGAVMFAVLATWSKGRALVAEAEADHDVTKSFDELRAALDEQQPLRVPGRAVFLTGDPDSAPTAFLHNLHHNKVVHEHVAFLHVRIERIPRVPREEKVTLSRVAGAFDLIVARYGFAEDASIPHVLALAKEQGLDYPLEEISFFLSRERLAPVRRPAMAAWRIRLFAFLTRNALGAAAYYHLPPEQVVELGVQHRLERSPAANGGNA